MNSKLIKDKLVNYIYTLYRNKKKIIIVSQDHFGPYQTLFLIHFNIIFIYVSNRFPLFKICMKITFQFSSQENI